MSQHKPYRIPPRGVCNIFTEKECKANKLLGCHWIKDKIGRKYCRGQIGSPKLPRQPPVWPYGISKCPSLNENECKTSKDCKWITPRKYYLKPYCRSKVYTTLPLSSVILSSPKMQSLLNPQLPLTFINGYSSENSNRYNYDDASPSIKAFTNTKRFSYQRYTPEEKESWYDAKAPMNAVDRKFCRCLLAVAAKDLFTAGQLTSNPYAVCNARISKSRTTTPQERKNLGSKLANEAIHGYCTKYAVFDNMPTPLLYAFAKMRERSSEGRNYFSNLPDVSEFLANMDFYRPDLLKRLNSFKRDVTV